MNLSVSDIRRVVQACEKQRFSLKPSPDLDPPPSEDSDDPSHFIIRANQGHSLQVESDHMLLSILPGSIPPKVLHGTFFYYWDSILRSGGLSRQSRQHIHCTTGTPEDGVIGMRHDAELIVEIDVTRSIQDGFTWWRSDNGYVLTEGDEAGLLPIKYFKEVRGRLRDVGILVRDGEVTASLPESIKIRPPFGKGTHRGGGKGRGGSGRGGRAKA